MNDSRQCRTGSMVRRVLAVVVALSLGLAFCVPAEVLADAVQDAASKLETEGQEAAAEQETAVIAVAFDANGGTGSMDAVSAGRGEEITVPPCGFEMAESEFVAWNSAADGSGTSYTAGQAASFDEDAVLYAQWTSAKEAGREDADPQEDEPSAPEPAYTLSKRRVTDAPEALGWFYITEDNKALTWEEYADQFESGEVSEGGLADSWEDDDDFYEDEDADVDLEDNGWFLDTYDFTWYFYVDDEDEEYAETEIPRRYRKQANDDGVAFGRLHDGDFGGVWYFSKEDECWHLVDADGKDHKRPSAALLEKLFDKYSDADDEDYDDYDDEDDEDDEDDYDEDDEDYDDEDYDEDEEGYGEDEDYDEDEDTNWESRIVGYGFGKGDVVRYEVTVENTGNVPLTLNVTEHAPDDPTPPAVGGVYPLDGSGTHPASTLQSEEEDAGEDDTEGDARPFDTPICEDVTGDGVVWNNSSTSKGATVPPNITIQPSSKALVKFAVTVTGSTDDLLSATSTDDAHGYAAVSDVDAAEADPAAESDEQAAEGDSTAETAAQESASAQEAESGNEAQAQQAVVHVPTRASFDETTGVDYSTPDGAKSLSREGKAWKRHAKHDGGKQQSTPPRTGDPAAPFGAVALLVGAGAVAALCSRTRCKSS